MCSGEEKDDKEGNENGFPKVIGRNKTRQKKNKTENNKSKTHSVLRRGEQLRTEDRES